MIANVPFEDCTTLSKHTFERARANVGSVLCVPLHGNDKVVVPVQVPRVAHVVSNALVDHNELNDVAEVGPDNVNALAKVLVTAVL
jgi:hypothetical protein